MTQDDMPRTVRDLLRTLDRVSLATSLPGLQLYTGNYLAGTPARDGGEYADYAGVALEPQFLPDSPHHPEWPQPSCWLEPGQKFHHWIQYQFR